MTVKENFIALLKEKGYKSFYEFCISNKIDYSNMNKRISGQKQKVEISFMFKLADILQTPIEKIIEIFYPDEWKENRKYK